MTELLRHADCLERISRCICFSSIRWLQNCVEAHQHLNFSIVLSVDGTPLVTPSGKKLMLFIIGTWDVRERRSVGGTDTTMSFRAFGAYLAFSEHWGTIAYTLLCLRYCLKKLYNLILRPRIGSCSDNSDSIIKAMQFVFGAIDAGISSEHTYFKFMSGSVLYRKGGVGTYGSLMQNGTSKDMERNLYPDVLLINLCITDAMMQNFAQLILNGWRTVFGETKIADTFAKSYIDQPTKRTWRYNYFGQPGYHPSQNPIESFMKMTKGTKNDPDSGMMDPKKEITSLLLDEIPGMVASNSATGVGVDRISPMTHESCISIHDVQDLHRLRFDFNVDIFHDCAEGKFYVNCSGSFGQPINPARLSQYKLVKEGKFAEALQQPEVGYSDKDAIVAITSGLCVVTKQRVSPCAPAVYLGSCKYCYQNLECYHAKAVAFKDKLQQRLQAYAESLNRGRDFKKRRAYDRPVKKSRSKKPTGSPPTTASGPAPTAGGLVPSAGGPAPTGASLSGSIYPTDPPTSHVTQGAASSTDHPVKKSRPNPLLGEERNAYTERLLGIPDGKVKSMSEEVRKAWIHEKASSLVKDT